MKASDDRARDRPPTEAPPTWRAAWHDPRFRTLAACTFGALACVLVGLNLFLRFNETRVGVTLVDPVLRALPAADLSGPLFALIYGSLALALLSLARRPRELVVALLAYALLMSFRMGMMYTIPLEPPPGMIMLVDPLARGFGDGPNWGKDLFFSGHTSTTFLCFLGVQSRVLKVLCLGACACVAVMILVQHAHYTIDVWVAPFVAAGSYRLALRGAALALRGEA